MVGILDNTTEPSSETSVAMKLARIPNGFQGCVKLEDLAFRILELRSELLDCMFLSMSLTMDLSLINNTLASCDVMWKYPLLPEVSVLIVSFRPSRHLSFGKPRTFPLARKADGSYWLFVEINTMSVRAHIIVYRLYSYVSRYSPPKRPRIQ